MYSTRVEIKKINVVIVYTVSSTIIRYNVYLLTLLLGSSGGKTAGILEQALPVVCLKHQRPID